jgi:tRNA(fMet)-specific endonuclease VapC
VRYLLDANCCIYLFTGEHPNLNRRVKATATGEIGLSAVTFAEVAHGSERGLVPPPAALDRFVKEFPIVPFDELAGRAYARLPFDRGNFDRLLAAHALSKGLAVITRNIRHFSAIEGLDVEDWTVS